MSQAQAQRERKTRKLREIAEELKNLCRYLESEVIGELEFLEQYEQTEQKPSLRINDGAFSDAGLSKRDVETLISISSYADETTGVTPPVIIAPEQSIERLADRGYLRRISGSRNSGVYKLGNRGNWMKLDNGAQLVWDDEE